MRRQALCRRKRSQTKQHKMKGPQTQQGQQLAPLHSPLELSPVNTVEMKSRPPSAKANELKGNLLSVGSYHLNPSLLVHSQHTVEYFINCAVGYCAFDLQRKLQRKWLARWKQQR